MTATFEYMTIKRGPKTMFALVGNFGDGPEILAHIQAEEFVVKGIVGALRHMDVFLGSTRVEEIVEKSEAVK